MSEPQRYSGPELGPILRQVRDELGEDAAIVEANKVRSGGVAGFFANEHYEVVADRRDIDPMAPNGGPAIGPAASPPPQVPSASQPTAETVARSVRNPATPNPSIQNALLERAEHVSTQELLSRAAEHDSISLGGDNFDSVLNHFLDEGTNPSQAGPEPQRHQPHTARQPPPTHRVEPAMGRRPRLPESPPPDRPRQELPGNDQAHHDRPHNDQSHHDQAHHDRPHNDQAHHDQAHHDRPHNDRPRPEPPPPERPRAEPPGTGSPHRVSNEERSDRSAAAAADSRSDSAEGANGAGRRSLFWRYILSSRGWRCPTVADARLAWFIGPYASANAMERRFGPTEPHDVMQLSPDPDLGPRWATTNSFDEALERCRRWRSLDVAGSIVVDYPAGDFDLRLLSDLSPTNCDVVHLVTDNLDRLEALIDLCHLASVPVMVDLTEAPPSSEIGIALDAGLPIASILGMEMTPQLIVAVRLDAAHGGGNG